MTAPLTCPDTPVPTGGRPAGAGHDRAEQDRAEEEHFPLDSAALEGCAAGDLGALEALYARHAGACLAHARLLLSDSGLAEDVVQGVFLELWRNAGRLDVSRSTVRTWLLVHTHRTAVDRARIHRRRRTNRHLPARSDLRPGPDPDALLTLLGDGPRRALACLPTTTRQVIVLAYWGGCTQHEIAALTGNPVEAVRTRMLAGLQSLGPATASLT